MWGAVKLEFTQRVTPIHSCASTQASLVCRLIGSREFVGSESERWLRALSGSTPSLSTMSGAPRSAFAIAGAVNKPPVSPEATKQSSKGPKLTARTRH